uniref:hypothetical protein n=1 Tax=Lachnospira sp. TaxID=2049031 RepID=UPI003FEFD146
PFIKSSLFLRSKNPNPLMRRGFSLHVFRRKMRLPCRSRGFVLLVFAEQKSESFDEERILPPCFPKFFYNYITFIC